MKKSWLLIIFGIIFLMGSCSNEKLDDLSQKDQAKENIIFEEKSVEEASMLYEQLIASFSSITPLKNASDLEVHYPDYFGGAYINDNGNLVVYIAGNHTKSMINENPILKNASSDNIIIKNVKYSYNTLTSVIESIQNYKKENSNSSISENIVLYYLSDEGNQVVVELSELSKSKIEEFQQNVLSSPCVIFKEQTSKIVDCASTSIHAGAKLTVDNPSDPITSLYRFSWL